MNLECIILNEVTQSQRKKNPQHVLSHMRDLANHICIYVNKCTHGVSMTCRKENEEG